MGRDPSPAWIRGNEPEGSGEGVRHAMVAESRLGFRPAITVEFKFGHHDELTASSDELTETQ
jgi:hypothetical protein